MSSFTGPNQQQDPYIQLIVNQIQQILKAKMKANIMLNNKYAHFIIQLLNQKQLIMNTSNKIYDNKIKQLLNQLNTSSNKNTMIANITNSSITHSNDINNIQQNGDISIPMNNVPISFQHTSSISSASSQTSYYNSLSTVKFISIFITFIIYSRS